MQWHPTILARLALVDQRTINSYSKGGKGAEYHPGDLVVRFSDCSPSNRQGCQADAQLYVEQWRAALKKSS